MKRSILKGISTLLIICLSIVMVVSPSFANPIIDDGTTLYKDGHLYEENFKDSEGNNINLIIERKGSELIASTSVNDILVDSANRKVLADGTLDSNIYYVNYSGDLQTKDIINVNDFLDKSKSDTVSSFNIEDELIEGSPSILSSPSYPYLPPGEYSSAWGYWGYLYGEQTSFTSNEKNVYFNAGTSLTIIALSLVGYFVAGGFSVAMLLISLGVDVYQNSILSAAVGKIEQDRSRWDYEVFVEANLALVAVIIDITTRIYDSNNRITKTYYDLEAGGPYKNRSEIIHYGIYSYAI